MTLEMTGLQSEAIRTSIAGGRVLTAAGGFADSTLVIADGRIAAIEAAESSPANGTGNGPGKGPGPGPGRASMASLDQGGVVHWRADGLLVVPGVVDLHGDAYERQLMPRPGVAFDHAQALADTDQQLLAAGITTAYYGVTCSWEPGLRSQDAVRDFLGAWRQRCSRLASDSRLHLRHELHNLEAVEDVLAWIDEGMIDLLSFNDHLPLIRERISDPQKALKYTARAGIPREVLTRRLEAAAVRAAEIPAALGRLTTAARERGIPMASHDDPTPVARARYDALGCTICEFPVDAATAAAANALHNPVVLGAPNVVRSGSHTGRLAAAPAIRRGLCTVLASDYSFPCLLRAPFLLAAAGVLPLADAWRLVSTHPAAAVGLGDRGTLAPGRRADILLVDAGEPLYPRVVAVFIAGRLVRFAAQAGAVEGDVLNICNGSGAE